MDEVMIACKDMFRRKRSNFTDSSSVSYRRGLAMQRYDDGGLVDDESCRDIRTADALPKLPTTVVGSEPSSCPSYCCCGDS